MMAVRVPFDPLVLIAVIAYPLAQLTVDVVDVARADKPMDACHNDTFATPGLLGIVVVQPLPPV